MIRNTTAPRRLRYAVVVLGIAATAIWAGSTLVENRQGAWAQEAAELQSATLPMHFAAPGDFFAGLR